MPKTGSTSIQTWLGAQASYLREKQRISIVQVVEAGDAAQAATGRFEGPPGLANRARGRTHRSLGLRAARPGRPWERLDFSDYGIDVNVTAPPPDQVLRESELPPGTLDPTVAVDDVEGTDQCWDPCD
jgi:hypothetical protein